MNQSNNGKSKSFSRILLISFSILFYFLIRDLGGTLGIFSKLAKVLSPFIIGFAIAYFLSRPVSSVDKLLNKFLFKKSKKQRAINRGISIFAVFSIVFFVLSVIMYFIIPQLIENVSKLARNMDGYIQHISTVVKGLLDHFKIDPSTFTGLFGTSKEFFISITEYLAANLPKLLTFSVSIGSGISNFFIGLVVSVYMLCSKEKFAAQSKKLTYSLFPQKWSNEILSAVRYMDETFGKYITGQLLDSFILGVVCFIIMSILNMEYALLISIIITITNLIPFLGPFIGAIPSAIILLMVQPSKVIWFIIMIVVLQQIEGNILAPKIVGKTTGLSSFWVIFAILLGGGLFGLVGVFLAVPTFSVVYTFGKRLIEKFLRSRGMSENTKDYYDM